MNHLPSSIKIHDADIDISIATKQGNSYRSTIIISFRKLILENIISNTGFVLWFSNYCLRCVLQHNGQRKTTKYYLAVLSSNGRLDRFQNINTNTDSLIQAVVDTMRTKFKCNETEYCIKLLCCSSQLSNAVTRQKIMRRFQSIGKRKVTADGKICSKRKNMQKWNQVEKKMSVQKSSMVPLTR